MTRSPLSQKSRRIIPLYTYKVLLAHLILISWAENVALRVFVENVCKDVLISMSFLESACKFFKPAVNIFLYSGRPARMSSVLKETAMPLLPTFSSAPLSLPLPVYIGSVSPSGRSVGGCPLALPFRREVYVGCGAIPPSGGEGRNGRKNNFRRGLRPQTVRVLSAAVFARWRGRGGGIASVMLWEGGTVQERTDTVLPTSLALLGWAPRKWDIFPHSKWRCAYFQDKSRK